MKTSDILVLARALISTGEYRYVCSAIRQVIDNDKHLAVTAIRKSIKGYSCIDKWLLHNSVEYQRFYRDYVCWRITSKRYNAVMKTYRVLWIDWMIEGYKRVGD